MTGNRGHKRLLIRQVKESKSPCAADVYLIENPVACIKLGDNKKSILGSPAYQGYFIAILMIK